MTTINQIERFNVFFIRRKDVDAYVKKTKVIIPLLTKVRPDENGNNAERPDGKKIKIALDEQILLVLR